MNQRREKQPLRVHHYLAALFLAVMVFIAFYNVAFRYLAQFTAAADLMERFHIPKGGAAEEITINLFVWMTVIGTGVAFQRGAQLGMVTLLHRLPARLRKMAVITGSVLSALLFLTVGTLMVHAIYWEILTYHARSASLYVPVWIYYAGVPLFSPVVFRGIYADCSKRLKECEGQD